MSEAIQQIPLTAIRLDRACQARVAEAVDKENFDRLQEDFEREGQLDPVDLYPVQTDGGTVYYLGDGHARRAVYQAKNQPKIPARLHSGGFLGAVAHACGANARHGLPRTNADKRRAVTLALEHFAKKSDRTIATMCHVSPTFVGKVRAQLSTVDTSREGADGKTYPAGQPKKPAAKPEQTDFFETLDKSFTEHKNGISLCLYDLSLTNAEIPHAERVHVARQMEDHLARLAKDAKARRIALEQEGKAK